MTTTKAATWEMFGTYLRRPVAPGLCDVSEATSQPNHKRRNTMSTATTTTGTVLIYTEARTSTSLSRRQMGPRDGWVPCGESTGTVTDNDRTPDPIYWLDEFVKPEVRELETCWADLEECGWAFEVRTAVVGEDGTEAELWRLTFYVEDGECEFTWDLEA